MLIFINWIHVFSFSWGKHGQNVNKELTKKTLSCYPAISCSYATIETGEHPTSRPPASSPLTNIFYTPPTNVSSDFQKKKIISIFLSTRHSSSLRSVSNLRAAPLILSSGGSQRERDEDVTVTAPHQGFLFNALFLQSSLLRVYVPKYDFCAMTHSLSAWNYSLFSLCLSI